MRTQALGHGLVAQSQRALAPFLLIRPRSLAELRQVLQAHPQATLVAGSTDVFARIREGLAPEAVVSLRGVPELAGIEHAGDELRLGATVTHHAGPRSDLLAQAVPGLAAAWASIATVRIRRSATLGGNLMARRVRYEMPVVLAALGARMEFLAGETVPVLDLYDTEPAAPGCLVAVAVPTRDLLWFGYDRSMRPLTTVALALRSTATGLAVTATVGSELTRPATLAAERAVAHPRELAGLGRELAAALPDEIADHNGPAAYRRHVAGVQIDRLLTRAVSEHAGGAQPRDRRDRSSTVTASADRRDVVQIDVEVNGQRRDMTVPTSTVLSDLLRDAFGLQGVRTSCERTVCGACTVLVDGVPTASCSTFAFDVDGARVRTVEGLADDGRLSAEQQAFAECGGFQCGFCTSGMLMLTKALLDEEPDPDRETIRAWISSNICRCTGYEMIMESVEQAAQLRAEQGLGARQ